MIETVILAAGKGTRMRSNRPKVLHTLAGKSFIQYVIDSAAQLHTTKTHIIVGHGADELKSALTGQAFNYVVQPQQLGTGHAVQQVSPYLDDDSKVLILYGDVPLIKPETLEQLIACTSDSAMGLLTVELDNPNGYGRIVRNEHDQITSIVEQKDASQEQLQIHEVNTGVMSVKASLLKTWLSQLSNDNSQGEYYLTDIIAMAVNDGVQVIAAHPKHEHEVLGVNDRFQQAELERQVQEEHAERLLTQGVSLIDPARFDLRGSLIAGMDCVIDINCVFLGENQIGNNVTFEQNCQVKNAIIGDNTTIKANSVLESCIVGESCDIGPFARLRPGTELANGAKVGNFVETKNAYVGKGSKINHLSYVGDAELGQNVNVGAGTITCNYDGANKHKTQIEDNVFVGSNSALVAPLTISKGATIGAGSTVTTNVAEGTLVVTRAKAQFIPNWLRPSKK